MKFHHLVIAFLGVGFAVGSDVQCYDCDPGTEGKCINPETDNVKSTVCKEDDSARIDESYLKKFINDVDRIDIERRNDSSDLTFECYSLYFETDQDIKPGVYRGCIEKNQAILSSCTYLQERLNKGNVTVCKTCSDDRCNTQYVGGAAALTISLGVVILNLVLCLKIFTF